MEKIVENQASVRLKLGGERALGHRGSADYCLVSALCHLSQLCAVPPDPRYPNRCQKGQKKQKVSYHG